MMGMNERPNNFRRVPFAEFEESHLFKVMRHFPELAKTLPEVHDMQVKMGRNWVDQKKPVKKEKQRERAYRSTTKLDSLKRSALLDNPTGHMDEMRKVLLISRNPNMADKFPERPRALEALDSNSQLDSYSKLDSFGEQSVGGGGGAAPLAISNGPTDVSVGAGRHHFNMMHAIKGDGSVGVLESNSRGPETVARSKSTASKPPGYDPLAVANDKMSKAAMSFTPLGSMNVLAGFQGQDLNKEELAVQLRRCLQIVLTKEELNALFESMDADGSGLIDGVEFTRYFLTMGNIARSKKIETKVKLEKDRKARLEKEAEEASQAAKSWEASQVSEKVSAEVEDQVFGRLAKIALYWDAGSELNVQKLQHFDCYLSPYQFKRQLELSLGLKATPIEMGALLGRYKAREGEFCIDGKAFLQSFNKLRRESASEHRRVLKRYAERKKKVRQMGQQETYYSALGR